jgi:hypothetical protein
LTINDSYVRLAAGADVKLEQIDPNNVVVDQLAGDVYHRVSMPSGGEYTAKTGSVTWVADGTAFDLDRSARASGAGDQVVAMALVDSFDIQGAGIATPVHVSQGMSVTVDLSSAGAAEAPPDSVAISTEALVADWIVTNANLDAQMELPMGVLPVAAAPSSTATPTPPSTEAPSASPTATGSSSASPTALPSGSATATPTPKATPKPTPTPTQKSTPRPTATPAPTNTPAGPVNLGGLGFNDNGDGTYTFTWTPYTGAWDDNTMYMLVYIEAASGAPNYPADNYWPGGQTTVASQDSFKLSAADLQPSGQHTYRMRLQVVRTGAVLAQTSTITVVITTP